MNRGRKINVNTMSDYFKQFILEKKAEGLAEKTLKSYEGCLYAMKPYMDINIDMEKVTDKMMRNVFAKLAETDLSRNSIRCYSAGMKSFFSWCRKNGVSNVDIPLFKGEESIPEIYSKEELVKLLKKPNLKNCSFVEYRTWVIINLFVNNGCRASTLRSIQIRDLDLENGVILTRHMKRRKSIQIPLGQQMSHILREYLHIREGKDEEWLFCNEDGTQMTQTSLRNSVERYNRRRGVERTGLHKFRNTFARIYLVECGGDALKLQKLLGHSTLDMTKHYVKLFNSDLVNDFNAKSPLDVVSGGSKIKMKR